MVLPLSPSTTEQPRPSCSAHRRRETVCNVVHLHLLPSLFEQPSPSHSAHRCRVTVCNFVCLRPFGFASGAWHVGAASSESFSTPVPSDGLRLCGCSLLPSTSEQPRPSHSAHRCRETVCDIVVYAPVSESFSTQVQSDCLRPFGFASAA